MADDDTERREEADDGSGRSEVEVLRSGREEARVVLDHQLQLLSGIHAKAMQTMRITGVVIGLLISAATLSSVREFVNVLTIGGVGCLCLAILSGLVTYNASTPKFGIGTEYLRDARTESYDEPEWFDVLLGGYLDWIGEMEEMNANNWILLTTTQLFLGLGVVLLAVGIAVITFTK